MKLYHYVHCPFCVRVRLACGVLEIPYESIVVPYDEERTLIELTGKKMLPIAVIDEKAPMNESLDIINSLDSKGILNIKDYLENKEFIEKDLAEIGAPVHSMAMPYWVWSPEFSPSSRKYFLAKKEAKRGPFPELMKRRPEFEAQLLPLLERIESELRPYYYSDKFTVNDILLASHLWGLFVVPEYSFSKKMYNYLMNVKEICKFNYHEDFWLKGNLWS